MQCTFGAAIQLMRRAMLERIYVGAFMRDHAAAAHPIARAIAAEVGCDPENPRPQSIFRLERRIGAIGAQPGLLEQIHRVVAIAGRSHEEAHDLALHGFHRLFERRRQFEIERRHRACQASPAIELTKYHSVIDPKTAPRISSMMHACASRTPSLTSRSALHSATSVNPASSIWIFGIIV